MKTAMPFAAGKNTLKLPLVLGALMALATSFAPHAATWATESAAAYLPSVRSVEAI